MAKFDQQDYDTVMEALDHLATTLGNSNLEEDKKRVKEVEEAEKAVMQIGAY